MIRSKELQTRRRERLFDAIVRKLQESLNGDDARFNIHGLMPADRTSSSADGEKMVASFLMYDGNEREFLAQIFVDLPQRDGDIPQFAFSRQFLQANHGSFSHTIPLVTAREHFVAEGVLPIKQD